jgi:hypothetical protein
MILHCPFCKASVAAGQQTCPACSKRMIRRCGACAEDIAIDSKTCKYCGEDLNAPSAARTPGIEFIEDAPAAPKKKRCCGVFGKLLLTAGLLFALGTAAVAVRTDCVACGKLAQKTEHADCSHRSHCNRKICRNGKTPLWATVVEKMGGKACSKKRPECCEISSPEPSQQKQVY